VLIAAWPLLSHCWHSGPLFAQAPEPSRPIPARSRAATRCLQNVEPGTKILLNLDQQHHAPGSAPAEASRACTWKPPFRGCLVDSRKS